MKVLRRRDFALLWWGQLVSQLGNQFNYVALAWLMLVGTGSAAAMGGVFLAQILPNATLGWVAGVWVDRLDRRKLMMAADLARGGLVVSLPLAFHLGWFHPALVYPVTFAVSALSLVFYSAEKSVLPNLVPDAELTEANAFSEMTNQAAGLAGPVLAGLLVAFLPSPVDVLYLDAGSFLVSALGIALLRWRENRMPVSPAERPPWWAQAREGLGFLVKDRFLRVVLLTATAANFLVMPFAVIFPVFSERALGTGSVGFGWLMGGIGAGLVAGSVAAAGLAARLRPVPLIYGGMVLLGAGFALLSRAPGLPVAVLLAAVSGFGVSPANAVVLTLVQRKTPAELQGRVFASLFALVGMAAPLGVAVTSLLLERWDPRAVLLGIGLTTVGLALLGGGLAAATAPPDEPQLPRLSSTT